MKILFPLLLSLVTAIDYSIDYSTPYYFDGYNESPQSLDLEDYDDIVVLPAELTVAELEVLHQHCVDQINTYRNLYDGLLSPLIPAKEWYSCSNAQAKGDLKYTLEQGGGCLGAHHTRFSACKVGRDSFFQGQNTCCAVGGDSSLHRGESFNTLDKVKLHLDDCLQTLWDQGIHPYWSQASWENMKSESFTHVSCGFAWTSNGGVMINQDFTTKYPNCTQPTCNDGTLQWDPKQCSPKSPVPTNCYSPPRPPSRPPSSPPRGEGKQLLQPL